MADTLNLRCQTKNGQHRLTGLTQSSSVKELKEKISELTKISKDWMKIKSGYPPKPIDISCESKQLTSIPIRSGDTLIIEEDVSMSTKFCDDIQAQSERAGGMLMRKVVPADNSCLFTSIDCVMNHGQVDLSCAQQMRQIIAGVVLSDPDTYTTAFLGRGNSDYCKWIMKSDNWGGAIELSILTKYYGVEMAVVDTQSARIDRFGEDQNYSQRVLLIYDGIHYDPLVMEPFQPGDAVKTIFSTADANVLVQAMEIANECKAARQFTDVSQFTLRCLICQKALVGQSEAQQHAKATGHINFGEYR